MQIVLWDVRDPRVAKDGAGGFGAREGLFPGILLQSPLSFRRRPAPLLYAYLAAGLRQEGHHVRYVADRTPSPADIYIFAPSLPTLNIERQMMARLARREPNARLFVIGKVAQCVPEVFADLRVTVVRGDAEQLPWTLDQILERPTAAIHLGELDDLNRLPVGDWGPFAPWNAALPDECWQFPTALTEHGRGCPDGWDHGPEALQTPRFRDAERVAHDLQLQINTWGFYSFKFLDPCFGWDEDRSLELVQELSRILQPFQFSIATRVELISNTSLRALRWVGLRSVTVPVATDEDADCTARRPAPLKAYRDFFDQCRKLGLRTTAVFSLGAPADTEHALDHRLLVAKELNPTFAKFRFVTPYPGTPSFQAARDRLEHFRYDLFTTQTPVLRTDHLSSAVLRRRLARCYRSFYLRWSYLRQNVFLTWPSLARWAWNEQMPRPVDTAQLRGPHHDHPCRMNNTGKASEFIRHDGPHDQPGVTDNANERHDLD